MPHRIQTFSGSTRSAHHTIQDVAHWSAGPSTQSSHALHSHLLTAHRRLQRYVCIVKFLSLGSPLCPYYTLAQTLANLSKVESRLRLFCSVEELNLVHFCSGQFQRYQWDVIEQVLEKQGIIPFSNSCRHCPCFLFLFLFLAVFVVLFLEHCLHTVARFACVCVCVCV